MLLFWTRPYLPVYHHHAILVREGPASRLFTNSSIYLYGKEKKKMDCLLCPAREEPPRQALVLRPDRPRQELAMYPQRLK